MMLFSMPAISMENSDMGAREPVVDPLVMDLVFNPSSKGRYTLTTEVDQHRKSNINRKVLIDIGPGKEFVPLIIVFRPGQGEILQTDSIPGEPASDSDADVPKKSELRAPGVVQPETVTGTKQYRPSFAMTTGYRNDSFLFTIPGSNNTPNIISELEWRNLHSIEIQGNFRWTLPSHFHFKAGAGFAYAADGDNRDSDYYGDNKTLEFSRSYADSDGSTFFDGSLGFGYRTRLPMKQEGVQLYLAPMAGYSFHGQKLRMRNGVQTIPDTGPFPGLNSFYEATWEGPWIGVDAEWDYLHRHRILASLEFHWADFEAEANWNLRSDLDHPVSFRQQASGKGCMVSISYAFTPTPKWEWLVGIIYKKLETGSGSRIHYLAGGTPWHLGFNKAEWESWSINLGTTYHF